MTRVYPPGNPQCPPYSPRTGNTGSPVVDLKSKPAHWSRERPTRFYADRFGQRHASAGDANGAGQRLKARARPLFDPQRGEHHPSQRRNSVEAGSDPGELPVRGPADLAFPHQKGRVPVPTGSEFRSTSLSSFEQLALLRQVHHVALARCHNRAYPGLAHRRRVPTGARAQLLDPLCVVLGRLLVLLDQDVASQR